MPAPNSCVCLLSDGKFLRGPWEVDCLEQAFVLCNRQSWEGLAVPPSISISVHGHLSHVRRHAAIVPDATRISPRNGMR